MGKLKSSSVSKKLKKTTAPKAVSVPKNVKIASQSTTMKPKAVVPLQAKSKSGKHKLNASKMTVTEVTLKPTIPQLAKVDKTEAILDSTEIKSGTLLIQAVNSKKRKKNKPANSGLEEPKNPDEVLSSPSKKKKKRKESVSEAKDEPTESVNKPNTELLSTKVEATSPKTKLASEEKSSEDSGQKYKILGDKELIGRFLKVPMSNNQKGRIRQAFKLSLKGTPKEMLPDLINGKIEAMLNSSPDLTESDLRRIRILFNMLKTSIEAPDKLDVENIPLKKDKKKEKNKENGLNKEQKEGQMNKVKGPKRYVVFLGNLPLDVDKEKIMDHFKELNEHIKDVRIPVQKEGAKSAIAFVELSNEPSYELALSKHHSMMGSQRIKVLYSTQQNSKISKSEAKSKSAKLIALQKAGKLIGSVPATKKRSHRRAIMKAAKAKEGEDA